MRLCWLALLLLAGCATVPTPHFQVAESRLALVNWRHGADSLTAEVTFQKSRDGNRRLIVRKGLELLVLTSAGEEWTATGPLARGGWRGSAAKAPAPLKGWICLAQADDGRSPVLRIECPNGDRFHAIF